MLALLNVLFDQVFPGPNKHLSLESSTSLVLLLIVSTIQPRNSKYAIMKAIKKVAAKAAGKVKLEYVDETASLVSEEHEDFSDYDESNVDSDNVGEVTRHWEKISQGRRYLM